MKQTTKTNSSKANTMTITLSLMFFAAGLFAQNPDSTYQEWSPLGESTQLIDFSARVAGCNGVNQVFLNVFNENPNQQQIAFGIKIINSDGREFTTQFNHTINIAEMNIAACGDTTYDNLKINLPADYDPSTVQVSIIF